MVKAENLTQRWCKDKLADTPPLLHCPHDIQMFHLASCFTVSSHGEEWFSKIWIATKAGTQWQKVTQAAKQQGQLKSVAKGYVTIACNLTAGCLGLPKPATSKGDSQYTQHCSKQDLPLRHNTKG